jgi:hypothetical protein
MLIPILLVIFVCCVLLWVVNASGSMPMPPPFVWGFNIVVLLVFLLIVLRLGGFNLGVL